MRSYISTGRSVALPFRLLHVARAMLYSVPEDEEPAPVGRHFQ